MVVKDHQPGQRRAVVKVWSVKQLRRTQLGSSRAQEPVEVNELIEIRIFLNELCLFVSFN